MPGSDYTINEFPFFSFILGDLHPHVMSIPFVITFVIIAIFIVNKHKIYSFETLILLVLFGITGFGVTFINTWNITIVMLITVGISLLKIFNYQNYPKNELLVLIISLLSMSLTLLFKGTLKKIKEEMSVLNTKQLTCEIIKIDNKKAERHLLKISQNE